MVNLIYRARLFSADYIMRPKRPKDFTLECSQIFAPLESAMGILIKAAVLLGVTFFAFRLFPPLAFARLLHHHCFDYPDDHQRLYLLIIEAQSSDTPLPRAA